MAKTETVSTKSIDRHRAPIYRAVEGIEIDQSGIVFVLDRRAVDRQGARRAS